MQNKTKRGKLLSSHYMLNMNLFNVFLVNIWQKKPRDKIEIVGEANCGRGLL